MEHAHEAPSKLRILVVDDSATIRNALARLLQSMGAYVCEAKDGEQGIEKALAECFDLIVTDVEMPNMSGLDLCRELKKHPDTRDIPVIIVSGNDSDAEIEQGFQAGASAYLPKLLARRQLQEAIQDVLADAWLHSSRLILVVEDSAIIRHHLASGLTRAGYQVAAASNGREALKLIGVTRPDLIISDIEMPVMDGVTFLHKVRYDRRLAGIPVVIMSANNDRAMMRQMMQRGASAYLVKPFNIEQMLITIHKLLSDQYLLLLKEQQLLQADHASMLASITSLAHALEARDPYTRGHGDAVAEIVTGMAARMNMPKEEMEAIRLGACLHDLGKIGVPDMVLGKPGKLSDEEYTAIKHHPQIGSAILRPIQALGKMIPIILHHHERYDGGGYPHGLTGEGIPLWARMTAVADTFHALTSDRPYRPGMSTAKAREIIRGVRGSQLCPLCVDVFLGM